MRGRGCRRTARSSNKLGPSSYPQCTVRISLLPRYFHILLENNHRKFTNAWRNSALSRIIIFANFDRASSRFGQTCPGVFANAMFTICKMWLHKLQQSSGVCTQSSRACGCHWNHTITLKPHILPPSALYSEARHFFALLRARWRDLRTDESERVRTH